MKKRIKAKDNLVNRKRMSWPTYHYLRCLIEDQQRKLEREYQITFDYVPNTFQELKDWKVTPTEYARNVFNRRYSELKKMKEELSLALQDHYRDHPNKEMREFWGIKE